MRSKLMTAAVALAVVAAGISVRGQSPTIPARATFRDAPADRIQSDHDPVYLNVYENDVACVGTRVRSNQFFLRTYSSSCFQSGLPPMRKITLDFGDALSRTPDGSTADPCQVDDAYGQAGTLNTCTSNVVADVRIIAESLFANNAPRNGTPVTLPFSLTPDFRNTAFELEFEQNVQVIPDPADATVREMEAGSAAVAELYKFGAGKRGKVSLGRYRMPFRLRMEKLY